MFMLFYLTRPPLFKGNIYLNTYLSTRELDKPGLCADAGTNLSNNINMCVNVCLLWLDISVIVCRIKRKKI